MPNRKSHIILYRTMKIVILISILIIPSIIMAQSEGEQSVALAEAFASGKVTVKFIGTGGSSGDTILLTIQKTEKAGAETLKLSIPPGTMLQSSNPSEQSMVIASIRGKQINESTFSPQSEIILTDNNPITYVLEAYCTEFHKGNPSSATGFNLLTSNSTLSCILTEGKKRNLSTQAIQAAIWIVTDKITYEQMNPRFPITKNDWEAGKSVADFCGKEEIKDPNINQADKLISKAGSLWNEKKYSKAISAAKEALALKQKMLPPVHPDIKKIQDMIQKAESFEEISPKQKYESPIYIKTPDDKPTAPEDEKDKDFPISISWKSPPPKSGRISEAPDILYKKIKLIKIEDVEVVIKIEAIQMEKDGFRNVTNTFAGPDKFKISETGQISAAKWITPLEFCIAASFIKFDGKGQMKVALFKARTGTEMPTEQITQWIIMPLQFSK